MIRERLAKAQFKNLKKGGGFSTDLAGNSPTVGYMVAIPGAETVVRSQNVAPAHIEEFVRRHGEKLSKPGHYVGGWDNKADGKTYLDVAQNIKPSTRVQKRYGKAVAEADALTTTQDLMVARNQIAAYDLDKGEDVPNPHYKAPK